MTRVLIAEDEPAIVQSLEFLLQEAGYEVYAAANGAQALELAVSHRPHLVLLDVMLPIVDGFEVCRSLRANRDLCDTRVLMLTARGREHEMAHGLALGADAYMTKPFATKELMRCVAELMGRPRPSQ